MSDNTRSPGRIEEEAIPVVGSSSVSDGGYLRHQGKEEDEPRRVMNIANLDL